MGDPFPIPSWLGFCPRPRVSIVTTSAYWVNKPVHKIKNKLSDKFIEHLHFASGTHIFASFCKSRQLQNIKKPDVFTQHKH